MRTPRFSIAGLMGVVLVAALGLAAVRSASEVWAGTLLLVTCGMLALAVVGVASRGEDERAWWLGFALFGWGFLALAYCSSWEAPKLPTTVLLEPFGPSATGPFGGMGGPRRESIMFRLVGHCLSSLLAAALGGFLAQAFFAPSAVGTEGRGDEPRGEVPASPRPWRRTAAIGLAVLLPVTAIGLAASRATPEVLTGVVFLLTWCLLGGAVLGAASGRVRRRTIWLGTALFGVGYMLLAFNRGSDEMGTPHIVTDRFLSHLREWLPSAVGEFPARSGGIGAANARIRKSLDQPVPMRYPRETPLEDVLKYVVAATRGPDGKRIQIYVDPVGLQEAEKTMGSPVQVDLDGVPLSTSLRLVLKQLGMDYFVGGGVLTVTSRSGVDISIGEDPFLVVGHCLLALFAAGLGGWVAFLISGPRGEPNDRSAAE